MSQDERCCGSGTCIIDADGLCWCGQRWQDNQLCSTTAQNHSNEPLIPQDAADDGPGSAD